MSNLNQPAPIRSNLFLKEGVLSPVWANWFENIRIVANTKLDAASDPTENNLVIFDADGNIMDSGIDVSQVIEPGDVTGTANQVVVTDNGDGTITLSLPQDIDTSADVTFNSLIALLRPPTGTATAGRRELRPEPTPPRS